MGNVANRQSTRAQPVTSRKNSAEKESIKSTKPVCRPIIHLGIGKVKVHSIIEEAEQQSVTELSSAEPEKLTDEEKRLLSSTWVQVEQDAERIGAITFVNLFEMHPDMKEDFIPFKSIEVHDERFNRILRNHGLRVLTTVGKMIHRLNEEEKMVSVVSDVGTRHGDYDAKPSLIDVMCPHFVKAIEGTLGQRWEPQIESAYTHLFLILSYYMKSALIVAQQSEPKCKKKGRR